MKAIAQRGAASLSDAQLLAIYFGWVGRDASAVNVEWRVLARRGGIYGLLHCSVEELCAIPGSDRPKARQLSGGVGKRACRLY